MAASDNTGLRGRTLFITGASRGIGLAIALRAAREGANVAVAAKTTEPHPTLPGTIYSAAEQIEAAGGKALALPLDVRNDQQVSAAIERTAEVFGGIDILVNNASAISLTPTRATDMRRFDLMHSINTRGTLLCSKLAAPYLARGRNPHILMLAPPLSLEARWFAPHLPYSLAKFGMSLCVLGLAGELAAEGIAVNALWPRTIIGTAALTIALADAPQGMRERVRTPQIVADAACVVLKRDSRAFTGQFCLDEQVLREAGVSDFSAYRPSGVREEDLLTDLFV
ncbi:MAG: SDR family oxidoreductase [Steroidobacteraceae bacterium]